MSTISVDLFGNLLDKPKFWREFLMYLKLEGIKVHIISGPWPKNIFDRLHYNSYKPDVHYDNVYSILSYLNRLGLDTWYDEDHMSWYSDKDAWWNSKALICREQAIQVHFDSDIRFGKAFMTMPTRFVYTGGGAGQDLVKNWHNKLKLANTYYEDANDELDSEFARIFGGPFQM